MSFFDMKARRENASKNKKVVGPPVSQPWVEKYRPKKLSEVSAQDHAINVLKKTVHTNNLPHMLFYGPPGTGKTSTILALAKELFGPELSKSRILELNASDERGISIVREKVKNFARISVSAPSEASRKAHPCPPFKIIILDEADSMTSDAQSALRRTMETYSKTTRFCLICNYVTRIIDPLASRCAKFRFRPLDENNALERLRFIADEEKLNYEDGVLESLLRSSEGDLRKAITFLQSSAKLTSTAATSAAGSSSKTDGDDVVMADADDEEVLAGAADRPTRITVRMVQEIAGVIPEDVINGLVAATKPANTRVTGFGDAVFRNLVNVVEEVILAGWSATQILTQLHDCILLDDEYSGEQKNRISWTLSEAETRLTDGADEHIEILNVLTQIAKAIF